MLVKDCLWKFIENALKNICFPADAFVQTPSGSLSMAALQVGDKVLALDGSYSDVYALSHEDHRPLLQYVQIRTQENAIDMSAKHFVPVSVGCDGTMIYTRAADVSPGMCVLTQKPGKQQAPWR